MLQHVGDFCGHASQEVVTYLFGMAKSMLIESKIKIGPDSMFNIHQANFKSAHLLDKMILLQSQSGKTVATV